MLKNLNVLNTTAVQDLHQSANGASPVPEGSNILLLLPPFYTPYTPPLGISVMKSYIEQFGYHVKCLDFNVIPHVWVAHHKYFEILQRSKGLTPQHGYTNLWYVLQAHTLGKLNGLDSQGCFQLLKKVLPVYDLEPSPEIINGLVPIVNRLFSDVEHVLLRELDLSSFAVAGTSSYSTSLGVSLYILKRIKELYPNIMTVMGGGVFSDDLASGSDNLETLLREYDFVDHIVMGEGEVLLRELLQGTLRHKRVLSRQDLPEPTLNMKEVKMPNYSDFHMPNYLHLCIEGARSCPFQCKFCSETVQWGNYRKKPSGVLADQMIHLADKHGNKTFFMGDSLMNPYIEDLSKSFLDRKADILYDGYLRADKIATDRDRTKRWAKSGCVRCRLGIESASANVLKAMQKETTPAGISKVIKSLSGAGIRVTTLWIVGFPGETDQDFQDTLDFIREHHRFIYELDVHYYYYYPYGQVWSRLHKSYPLYSPDVIKYVKFQQWEIEDCDPPRAVKFDRLRRINDLATEMGIPNLHTLDARYRAEERWHLLFPLATEFFEGTFISRVPFSPSEEARQLLPSNDLRDTKSHQTALAYVVRVSKQIAEATLRRAAQTLIEYNEILQFDAENRAWLAEGLPPDLGDRVVSVIEMSSVETPEALKETATLLSSGLQPRTGDSIRIAVANGSDSAVLVVAADRAVADARSVALFLEDLFRIYEQLANDKPVTLRRPDASYCEYLQKWGAFDSLAPASSPVEPCPHQSSERRQGATIMVETDILRRFTPRLQKQSGLSFPEFVLGGLALSLAEAGLETPSELEIRADLRLIRPEMRFTACPLHSNCHITLSNQSGEPALATALNIRKKLHEAFIQNRPGGAASVALDLEGLTDEPWVGGDEWVPQGFVPLPAFAGDAPVKLSGFLDCGRVSFTVEYSEDQAALVERWSAALEGRTGGVWERLIEEIENSVADGCRSQAEMELPGAPRYQPRRRRGLSASDLVEFEAAVGSAKPLPLIARSSVPDLDPIAWAAANRERVDQLLLEHGAILFRGFNLATPERFRQFAASLSNELLEFSERAAPRLEVAPRVYTSTEYPPEYPIPIHHENSFAYRWPMKLFFYCQLLAKRGGNTPIANSQRFLELLDPEIRERFREKQLMYVRNYTVGVDLRWQEVFQTDDRSVVEEYCRNAGLQYEWLREDWLRTTRIAPAILKHPRMGKDVWFNHAHMFHTSNVEPSLRELFVQEFREQDLPRNTYYGDGTPIENDVSEHIRETYRKASVRFPWQEQDVLLLDNMAVAHGREAFVGDRKILVAMADWSS